jgi:hypothetical protein
LGLPLQRAKQLKENRSAQIPPVPLCMLLSLVPST